MGVAAGSGCRRRRRPSRRSPPRRPPPGRPSGMPPSSKPPHSNSAPEERRAASCSWTRELMSDGPCSPLVITSSPTRSPASVRRQAPAQPNSMSSGCAPIASTFIADSRKGRRGQEGKNQTEPESHSSTAANASGRGVAHIRWYSRLDCSVAVVMVTTIQRTDLHHSSKRFLRLLTYFPVISIMAIVFRSADSSKHSLCSCRQGRLLLAGPINRLGPGREGGPGLMAWSPIDPPKRGVSAWIRR